MEEKYCNEIIDRLDKLIRIVALTGLKDLTSTQKIALLSQVGFGPKEIAEIIGTNQNVVNVRLSEMRKAKSEETSKKKEDVNSQGDKKQ